MLCIGAIAVFNSQSFAQTARKAVSGTEVTGTFRDYLGGKFKGSANEIKISALGKGKLKIAFDLIYPYIDGTGEKSANMGAADGIANISGDTAIFTMSEFGECKITVKFLKPGAIKVTQNGSDFECGFGHNVSASGDYRKTGGAKPNFDNPNN